MELTKEQEAASKFHLEALKSLRKYWATLYRGRMNADATALMDSFSAFYNAHDRARHAYAELTAKFPNAPSILFAHADFQETVCNDFVSAAEMRTRAEAIVEANERDAAVSDNTSSKGPSVSSSMRGAVDEDAKWVRCPFVTDVRGGRTK
jgi:hypothetical protein